MEKRIRYNDCFAGVNRSRARYRVLKGSAGSGKSYNTAQDLIRKLSDERYRGANLLVVRKVGETHRDSTYAELCGCARRMFGEHVGRVWRFTLSPLGMECLLTGNRIAFRGMHDAAARERVKSIAFEQGKLTWIWVEEATELTEADFELLDDRLRGRLPKGLYYQMTLTFNPVSATHWLKQRFFDRKDADALTHSSTYRDNRFIDAAFARRMAARSLRDPEGYRVYGLGDWGLEGGAILTNWRAEDFDASPEAFDYRRMGQDFGYNHANAIVEVGWRDGLLHICRELVCHEKDTAEIIALADAAGLDRRVPMLCDAAEPDRIKTWRRAGYAARAVSKGAGSVRAGIEHLKGYREILVHPSCVHTLKELGQWRWLRDARSGAYLDEPAPFFDDAMAALRYAIDDMRRGTSIKAWDGAFGPFRGMDPS